MAQEETDCYTLWPQQWMFDYQSSKAVKIQHDDWFIDYDHCPNVLDPNSGSWRHVPKSMDWQSWLQTWLLMLLLHSWVNYQEWGNSASQEIVDLWTWKHGSAVKEWCCACDHCCDCLKGVTSTVKCNLIGFGDTVNNVVNMVHQCVGSHWGVEWVDPSSIGNVHGWWQPHLWMCCI